ncbi:hypothetical protein HYU23_00550 [Candidatus Woesearchaeota archaeon]|nr:hypothetical protein [Candidatus Woesearchaeota archaeon]
MSSKRLEIIVGAEWLIEGTLIRVQGRDKPYLVVDRIPVSLGEQIEVYSAGAATITTERHPNLNVLLIYGMNMYDDLGNLLDGYKSEVEAKGPLM